MVKCNSNVKEVNFYNKPSIPKININLDAELNKITEKIKSRVAMEIPDRGYFRNFAENFEQGYNSGLFCKNIALFVERDEKQDGNAYLGISVLHPTMNQQVSTYLMRGDRKSLLEFLNGKEFNAEFKDTVLKLTESLERD